MSRALEEILNTPVKFEEGMRVFSLLRFKFGTIDQLDSGTNYPIYLLDDNGNETSVSYTIGGKHSTHSPMRHLLTEQEAYELFPSLKPKVYEYRAIYKKNGEFRMTMSYIANENEFTGDFMDKCEFVELYQPSKRERKS